MRNLLQLWQTWALLSALFAAATAVLAKVGVSGVDSDLATLVRTAIVLLFAALIVAFRGVGDGLFQMSGRTWLFLALSGMATGASWLCYFRALKLGDAARVAPLDKLSVVLVALFAIVFLGERLSPLGITGIALITTGAVLVAWQ
jgi:bacterial/archaeal transporter family protein